MKKLINKEYYSLIGLIILFLLIATSSQYLTYEKDSKETESDTCKCSIVEDTVYINNNFIGDELTIDNVYNYIKYLEIKYDSIVLKQVILETGNLSCSNCSLDVNNLFGFRYNKQYIKFDHWKHSIRYYANWQYRKYKKGDYYQFLINVGYATDSNYIQKLKKIYYEQ
jgi:hypothetical protein